MGILRGNKALRFFDRSVGVPMVAVLALLRRTREVPADPRTIGIMKSVALGDLMLTEGVIRDIRAHFPRARIVLINGDDNRSLGQLFLREGDTQLIVSPYRLLQSIRALRRANLDILLDFGAWPRFDAVLSALSGARFTVGFDIAGQWRHHAYDRAVPYSHAMHELENDRRIARVVGVESRSVPHLEPPRVLAAGRLPSMPFAVFHAWPAGFMSQAREWPIDRWLELAAAVNKRGWSVLLTGGAGDVRRSRELANAIAARSIPVMDLAGQLRIPELIDALSCATVVVSVNTGVMHLAAAVGVPSIGLQGPTSSVRWGPVGKLTAAVDSRLPGCGYLSLGWEYDGQRLDCMRGIEVTDVTIAIDGLAGAIQEKGS